MNKHLNSVTLYLRGDNIDFEEVTRLLGVEPDRVQRKGDCMVPGHPTSAEYRNNTWRLSVKSETDDVSGTFLRLMSKLSPGTRLCDIAGVTEGLFFATGWTKSSSIPMKRPIQITSCAGSCRISLGRSRMDGAPC